MTGTTNTWFVSTPRQHKTGYRGIKHVVFTSDCVSQSAESNFMSITVHYSVIPFHRTICLCSAGSLRSHVGPTDDHEGIQENRQQLKLVLNERM